MASSFFNAPRGCVIQIKKGASTGYKLQGFDFTDSPNPIILRNCSLTDEDIVLPVSTLDKRKVLYTFGPDFGQLQIMGTVFLGPVGETTQGLAPIIEYFNKYAVARAENPKPVKFSLPGGNAYDIYIKALAISEAEPELNSHSFAIGAIIADTMQ